MNRLAWSYLILVFLPAIVLAVFAFRVADQDYDESRAARQGALESAAETLASRIEAAVDESVRRADEALASAFEEGAWPPPLEPGSAVGFARSGAWLGYGNPRRPPVSVLPEDLKTYRFSVRGGEYYEFTAKEPELALDAYAFYLPKLRSLDLRCRLRFRIARAALAAGREELGREILRELMNTEDRVASEDDPRLPLNVLAALTLLEHLGQEDGTEAARMHAAFRDQLLRRHHELPTDVLAFVVRRAGVRVPELQRVIRARRTLESALERHPGLLTEQDALLEGDRLALARPVPAAGTELRAICDVPVSLPSLVAGPDHVVRLDTDPDEDGESGPGDGESATAEDLARFPVRLDQDGPIVARVELRDTRMAQVLAALAHRRNLQRTLIAFLVALALAGGGALVYYLARERRLARLRTQLLANVSHELKTPATSIRMLSEMLHRDDLEESKSKRFAELLHGESLRLGRIIENVLEFSRIERGREAFAHENVDLRRVVERVLESMSYRLREEKIELTREGDHLTRDGSPIGIFSNESAIECILFNLLDNAIKYSTVKKTEREEDGVGFRPEIRLNVEVDPALSVVRIAVTDNGIGIPAREQERVFEEFYRARFEDYGVQGTGLGLSISRALARKLGGDIDVRSTPGEGSTFRLTLPRAAGSRAVPPGSERADKGEAGSVQSCLDPSPSHERSNAAPLAPARTHETSPETDPGEQ